LDFAFFFLRWLSVLNSAGAFLNALILDIRGTWGFFFIVRSILKFGSFEFWVMLRNDEVNSLDCSGMNEAKISGFGAIKKLDD
jgi:hypothetical protein